ncbi:hypothetical protein GLOTRDRAFT_120981 [Gloeophyllum trabeum ATCC 11539]|uniref:Uncharacterized protein n=1 Tax=Gloeophyllum trabeum (strain ATCC 11539 / FP-39264 / Madison 617) TaxID=670483 RepID=S7QB52_GLOTA|nr:uncharacterized protein GLOTRDRAFT_120981 [Gloeophyllum trabeum ATCC 11539]EPQ56542.1 hypothetical protein GLOTRDRAFT_120981 [Gloeophyllum trabeum ATCC 11539]
MAIKRPRSRDDSNHQQPSKKPTPPSRREYRCARCFCVLKREDSIQRHFRRKTPCEAPEGHDTMTYQDRIEFRYPPDSPSAESSAESHSEATLPSSNGEPSALPHSHLTSACSSASASCSTPADPSAAGPSTPSCSSVPARSSSSINQAAETTGGVGGNEGLSPSPLVGPNVASTFALDDGDLRNPSPGSEEGIQCHEVAPGEPSATFSRDECVAAQPREPHLDAACPDRRAAYIYQLAPALLDRALRRDVRYSEEAVEEQNILLWYLVGSWPYGGPPQEMTFDPRVPPPHVREWLNFFDFEAFERDGKRKEDQDRAPHSA